MVNGNAQDYWENLIDVFADVTIGLEARIALLRILQDIFYQTLSMSDLKAPQIITNKKK